jgi:dihydroorotate dehydrogenase (fumarate)
MNLATKYLGLDLRSPLVPSASPLSENLGNLKRMEDAGAAAVVFHSIFEEQLREKDHTLDSHLTGAAERLGEVLNYFPAQEDYRADPEQYLRNLVKAKRSLGIPVIASMNGTAFGGWTAFARDIEAAGADALEINIYSIPTDPSVTSEDIELSYRTLVATLKAQVKIPVAVKLSPYFTNFSRIATQLDRQGVDGLVLFNRFYQPDIDIESREITPTIQLTAAGSIRLPLRWIAILRGQVNASLAATTGVYSGADAIKLTMAGADVTMLCSVLLKRGIPYLTVIEKEMIEWLERAGCESLGSIRGCMSQLQCADPMVFERAQYMRALASDRLDVDATP